MRDLPAQLGDCLSMSEIIAFDNELEDIPKVRESKEDGRGGEGGKRDMYREILREREREREREAGRRA